MAVPDESKLRYRNGKVYKEKPKFPPIADMLANGSPEQQGKEKTFLDYLFGPGLLAIVFFISFLIFINAPHHLSKGKERQPFGMNEKPYKEKKMKPAAWDDFKVEKDPITGGKAQRQG